MKKLLVMLVFFVFVFAGCNEYVKPGYVGIKVNMRGGNKGIDESSIIDNGKTWVGWYEELYVFPTFQQNYVYTASTTEQSTDDESFTFQSREGLSINTDVAMSMEFDKKQIPIIFQTYQAGVKEIVQVIIKNQIRDALIHHASRLPIEALIGEQKAAFMADVTKSVTDNLKDSGIRIKSISCVGELRLPETVVKSINDKITATQIAIKAENELRTEQAEANKKVVNAKAEADSTLLKARAQAEANLLLAKSLTPELVQYKFLQEWNGALPVISGGNNAAVIDMKSIMPAIKDDK